MNNDLPEDWEPGNNIKWESGTQGRAKTMAASLLMILAVVSLTLCAAVLSSCARFQNHGEMFEKGIFEKGDSITHD
jgi:hypothetical protein